MEKKSAILDETLDLIKINNFGISTKKIAEKLGYSRTTIRKYLKILETDGLIFDREMGQYKIWLHIDAKEYFGKERNPGQNLILQIYHLLLKSLKLCHPELIPEMGKEMGKSIGLELDFENYIDFDLKNSLKDLNDLDKTAKFMENIMNNLYLTGDSIHFDPHVSDLSNSSIILRIRNSDFIDIPLEFYFMAGIMEKKMSFYYEKLFKKTVMVDIIGIVPEINLVDMKISFEDIS
ncbi:MAG: HTH domain-containing protein [archaeon]|nr:HTH domain-containing protein [archaeon]